MADATEDAILTGPLDPTKPTLTRTFSASSSDNEDENVADFRFLMAKNALHSKSKATGAIPKRGMKDFEQHNTDLQSNTLQASRDAMLEALSYTRTHNVKSRVFGVFDEASGWTIVKQPKGAMFSVVGISMKGGGAKLRREEALWALESGRMEIFWKIGDEPRGDSSESNTSAQEGGAKVDTEEEDTLMPMSLQAAYAAYLGTPGHVREAQGDSEDQTQPLLLEEYIIFANLKRAGFIVRRPVTSSPGALSRRSPLNAVSMPSRPWSLLQWLTSLLSDSSSSRSRKPPLVAPGLYRSYAQVYKQLQLIPSRQSYQPTPSILPDSQESNDRTDGGAPCDKPSRPLNVTYHLWRPNQKNPFRKSAPPPPDFYVCVLNARTTPVPTLPQIDALLDQVAASIESASSQTPAPDTQPDQQAQKQTGGLGGMYKRLKDGVQGRNVVLAVVDEGIFSYMRVAETAFAAERLCERDWTASGRGGGAKRGGGRRGRGRGRGR